MIIAIIKDLKDGQFTLSCALAFPLSTSWYAINLARRLVLKRLFEAPASPGREWDVILKKAKEGKIRVVVNENAQ